MSCDIGGDYLIGDVDGVIVIPRAMGASRPAVAA